MGEEEPRGGITKTHSAGVFSFQITQALGGGLENHGVWSQRTTAETGCIWNEEEAQNPGENVDIRLYDKEEEGMRASEH